MAYIAGLSFWSKLLKYLLKVNHIGRFYDRKFKIYQFEDEQQLINSGYLLPDDRKKIARNVSSPNIYPRK